MEIGVTAISTTPATRPQTVWSHKGEGRFPDIKELKQRVRDRIAPGRLLGHSDQRAD